jgi:hypothetical protein
MTIDEDDRLVHCECLLDFLPAGLVFTSKGEDEEDEEDVPPKTRLWFAHFSMKEYLTLTRILDGGAPTFYVQKLATGLPIPEICFANMIWMGNKEPKVTNDMLVDFPLFDYCAAVGPDKCTL